MLPGISRYFIALLVTLTIANIVELLGYPYFHLVETLPDVMTFFLKIYYVTLIFLFSFLLQITIAIVRRKSSFRFSIPNLTLAVLFSCFMFATDLFVSGVESIGYTITRVPGEYYYVFQIYALVMLFSSIGVCIYGYFSAGNHYSKIQCTYVILSVVMMSTPIFLAMAAMSLGMRVNAAVILPIGVSLFLIILTYALNAKGIYNLRVWIPGTQMFKLYLSLHKEFMIYPDGTNLTAKERNQRNEKRFLIEALIKADGNQGQAARNLNISQSSMSVKRKFYKI